MVIVSVAALSSCFSLCERSRQDDKIPCSPELPQCIRSANAKGTTVSALKLFELELPTIHHVRMIRGFSLVVSYFIKSD